MTLDRMKEILAEYEREVVLINEYDMIVTNFINPLTEWTTIGFPLAELPGLTEDELRAALDRPMIT